MSEKIARPIHLNSGDGGDANIGTGFLVRNGAGNLLLVTAAHVPNMQNRPTTNFQGWRSVLILHGNDNKILPLPLFASFGTEKTPLFKYLANSQGELSDYMAVPLPANCLPYLALDEAYVIQLPTTIRQLQRPGPISGFGYPYKGGVWPYSPPDKVSGLLVDTSGLAYRAQIPTQRGHSGGPAFTPAGSFVGMMIGSTDEQNIIVSDVIISALVNDNLRTTD